jgi:hypothetical protein
MSRTTSSHRRTRGALTGVGLLALAPLLLAGALPATAAPATTDNVLTVQEAQAMVPAIEAGAPVPDPTAPETCIEIMESGVNVCAATDDALAATLLTDYNVVQVQTPADVTTFNKAAKGKGFRTESGAQITAVSSFGSWYENAFYGGTRHNIASTSSVACTGTSRYYRPMSPDNSADSWVGANGCAGWFYDASNNSGYGTYGMYNQISEFGKLGMHDQASSVTLGNPPYYRTI